MVKRAGGLRESPLLLNRDGMYKLVNIFYIIA